MAPTWEVYRWKYKHETLVPIQLAGTYQPAGASTAIPQQPIRKGPRAVIKPCRFGYVLEMIAERHYLRIYDFCSTVNSKSAVLQAR